MPCADDEFEVVSKTRMEAAVKFQSVVAPQSTMGTQMAFKSHS
jgi:hypothetical protein